jgi:ribose 1,5-bisphosphokinase PhnN
MVVSKARQVEISQRRYQAVQMRIAGVSPTVIADRLGYSGAASVSKDIDRALQKAVKQGPGG